MRTRAHVVRRVGAGVTLAAAILLATATAASAHVTIQETDQVADSYTVLTFGVPHGCDGSPTTKIRIQMPESIPTVTPTVNPFWDVSTVKEKLDTPIDLGEGESLTERITEVVYTRHDPLPVDLRDALQLSVHIPAHAGGTTLYFPTIQECEQGSTTWTGIPEKGQDPFELPTPAPFINVSAAAAEGETTETTEATETEAAAPRDDSSSNALAAAGLATGVVGIIVGAVALSTARKISTPEA